MFIYGLLYMDVPVLADQQKFIYIRIYTGYSFEELLRAMYDRDGCREGVMVIQLSA